MSYYLIFEIPKLYTYALILLNSILIVDFMIYFWETQALDYLGRSHGIHRTRELATKHANLAASAIESLPESEDEDVRRSRRALLDLTHIVITRIK